MSITKTLILSLVGAIIFAVQSTPSFAAPKTIDASSPTLPASCAGGGASADDGSIWDYIMSMLW